MVILLRQFTLMMRLLAELVAKMQERIADTV